MQTYVVQAMSKVSGATFPVTITIEAESDSAAKQAVYELPQVISVDSSRALSAAEVAAWTKS